MQPLETDEGAAAAPLEPPRREPKLPRPLDAPVELPVKLPRPPAAAALLDVVPVVGVAVELLSDDGDVLEVVPELLPS